MQSEEKAMTKDEALDLALYALKELVAQTEARLFAVKHDHVALQNAREAITAIKQARSAPVQDKGPWIAGVVQGQPKRVYIQSEDFKHDVRLYVDGDFASDGQRFEYAEQMAQQFNTTPPAAQRRWVGLTDEQIDKLFGDGPYVPAMLLRDVARAIEAKLKEKNT